jgi:hypothetical protein
MRAVACCEEMGEGTHRRARSEPHAGKRRSAGTASSPKTRPKWIGKGLSDLSTMSHGSTYIYRKPTFAQHRGNYFGYFLRGAVPCGICNKN